MKRVSAEQSSLGVREASQATCCMTPVKARRIVAILTNSSRHALQQPNQGGRLGLHVQDPPAVPARLVVGDLVLVEEFHQRWPADPEEVSGLLGGEPLGLRRDGDHFSLAQGFDDLRPGSG